MAAHADRELGVGHGVHGCGQEGDLQPMPADLDGQVHLGRIDGDRAGHERDLVEAIRAPQAVGGGGERSAARSSGHGHRYEKDRGGSRVGCGE